MHCRNLNSLSRRLRSCSKRTLVLYSIVLKIIVILCYVAFTRHRRNVNVSESTPVASFILRSMKNHSLDGERSAAHIPRIIHQTWSSSNSIPETFRPWMESWITQNDNWDYWFWTDEDMRALISTAFPDYLALYDSYPTQFYRVDAFRYFLIYAHGGVYADLDMECIQPFDNIDEKEDCIVSQEPLEHAHFLANIEPPLVSNALMACRRGHPFFKNVIDNLDSYTGFLLWNDILHATGPFMLTDVFGRYNRKPWFSGSEQRSDSVQLADPERFQPQPDDSMVDHMRKMCEDSKGKTLASESFTLRRQNLCGRLSSHNFGRRIIPNALTNHHWTHTWAGKFHDPWAVHDMRIRFPVSDLLSVRDRRTKKIKH